MFLDGRFQQFLDLVQSQTAILLSDGTLRRHPDANELVTFSVFAFARFEPSQISGTFPSAACASSRFKAARPGPGSMAFFPVFGKLFRGSIFLTVLFGCNQPTLASWVDHSLNLSPTWAVQAVKRSVKVGHSARALL
jgi:hypothetical protein